MVQLWVQRGHVNATGMNPHVVQVEVVEAGNSLQHSSVEHRQQFT